MDKTLRLKSVCRGRRRHNAWSADYDYLSKLTAEELQFLASFSEYFYHGNPQRSDLSLTKKDYRESYKRSNDQRVDALNTENIVYFGSIKILNFIKGDEDINDY